MFFEGITHTLTPTHIHTNIYTHTHMKRFMSTGVVAPVEHRRNNSMSISLGGIPGVTSCIHQHAQHDLRVIQDETS